MIRLKAGCRGLVSPSQIKEQEAKARAYPCWLRRWQRSRLRRWQRRWLRSWFRGWLRCWLWRWSWHGERGRVRDGQLRRSWYRQFCWARNRQLSWIWHRKLRWIWHRQLRRNWDRQTRWAWNWKLSRHGHWQGSGSLCCPPRRHREAEQLHKTPHVYRRLGTYKRQRQLV